MKKIKFLISTLLVATLFSLNSCGSDEPVDGFSGDTTAPTTPTTPDGGSSSGLVKKIIDTDSDGEKTTTIYTYDGNKIVSLIDDTGDAGIFFTYTGDLITKQEFKFPDGTIEQVDTFTYTTDGKLATYVRVEPKDNIGYKEVYTYNSDGSVSVNSYNGDINTQTDVDGTSVIKFVNGEVSEITSTNSPNYKYVYDTKNNPAKNVLGWDKIVFYGGTADGISHNIISETSNTDVWTTTLTYNSDSYPITSIETDPEGKKITTQYFY